MGNKSRDIRTLTKRLITYSKRLAINYTIPGKGADNYIDAVNIKEISNQLEILFGQHRKPKSKYKQLEINYTQYDR